MRWGVRRAPGARASSARYSTTAPAKRDGSTTTGSRSPVRAARLGLWRGDLPASPPAAARPSLVLLATSTRARSSAPASPLGLIAFAALVAAWLACPAHRRRELAIPLFAVLPTAKVFVSSSLGPVKDAVTLAAGVAVLITVVRRHRRPDSPHVDSLLFWLVLVFGGLYLVNLGGTIAGGGHGIAWAQGFRLVCEPLILLLAGLTLPNPRRSLDIAVASLIAHGRRRRALRPLPAVHRSSRPGGHGLLVPLRGANDRQPPP